MKRKCLMAMIEKWRACADDGQIRGAILTDSFFVFDCIKLRNLLSLVSTKNLSSLFKTKD